MNKSSNLNNLNPCIVKNEECVVAKQNYKLKKVCFPENSGQVSFYATKGIFIVNAIMYSENNSKIVTKKIKQHVGQTDDSLYCIKINTFIFNKFTRGEIECGSKKHLIIEYITEISEKSEQKKIIRVVNKNEYYTRKIINNSTHCDLVNEVPFEKQSSGIIYLVNKQDCDCKES